MGQVGSTGTFNTLWINGVFKGYYNLTERLREGFMQQHHASSERWDVQQVNDFSDGDPIHWNKMISYLRGANLANSAAYLGVHDFLDVDNFIDYLLLNAFAGMWDWPHNNWIVSGTRRDNFFSQLAARNHWPSVSAPTFSHYGGTISAGQQLVMGNPNGSGTLYFRSDGIDPRAPGGAINGSAYTAPLTLNASTSVRARVRSSTGVWSPEIAATFVVPPPRPTFLPVASADWTVDSNWSTKPSPYPNDAGLLVTIPAVPSADRNANLRAPVIIGGIEFQLENSNFMNRLRDRDTGNTLTFSNSGGARIEVTGDGTGYAEIENVAGTILTAALELRVAHLAGNPEHGALRLRETWTGPGGLNKTGIGIASLTGGGKSYTGPTTISEGVLRVTQPATPFNSPSVTVMPGGQLRLSSGGRPEAPSSYTFGGPVSLDGHGRGDGVPAGEQQGILGALRYDPGSGGNNHAVITTPVHLTGPTKIHVNGAPNRLEIAGPFGGPHPLGKSGGGTLVLSGDLSSQEQEITVSNGSLVLAAETPASFSIGATATLGGHGSSGAITGDGTFILENARWSAPSVGVGRQVLVFGKTGAPDFSEPATAGNAVLVLTSPPSAGATLDLMIQAALPADGEAFFQGGWMTPHAENLAQAVAAANVRVFVPDPAGSTEFNGATWTETHQFTLATRTANSPLGGDFETVRMLELRTGNDLPPTRFAAWRARYFPDPADRADDVISGPAATPSGDGLGNLLAYALGVGPGDPAVSLALPRLLVMPEAVQFQFPFDSSRDDIACVVETTDDLTNWESASILFDSAVDFPPLADEQGRITIPDSTPPAGHRFYRLRVVTRF